MINDCSLARSLAVTGERADEVHRQRRSLACYVVVSSVVGIVSRHIPDESIFPHVMTDRDYSRIRSDGQIWGRPPR